MKKPKIFNQFRDDRSTRESRRTPKGINLSVNRFTNQRKRRKGRSKNRSIHYLQTFSEKGERPLDINNVIDKHLLELNVEALDLWEIPLLYLTLDQSKNSGEYQKLKKIGCAIEKNIQSKTDLLKMAQDCIKGLQQINKWDQEHEKIHVPDDSENSKVDIVNVSQIGVRRRMNVGPRPPD